ncbi:hypothetical protein Pme01_14320 [Planosporangium mesophilum]|uniref:Uncharacterized protein n=1 Tax=Planosporangium mesophilum TaxID=689768 RepID=A0A8J3T785_9ACTN|nr:hypothetical protein Pme01_14320 [Planosporangium mesophilum]
MPVDVTLMMASSGSWIAGSGTVSTRTSRFPCQVTAFIAASFRSGGGGDHLRAPQAMDNSAHASGYPGWIRRNRAAEP